MPKAPVARHRVRLYNKLIDEYVHNSCTILTFATAFRPRFLKMKREDWLAEINKAPLKRRAEYKRSVIEHGLDSEFVVDAVHQHQKLISWMTDDLQRGPYLTGDAFSNADCAVIPYILRLELLKLDGLWNTQPAIADWWQRVQKRPSVKATIFERMKEMDWAPFRNLSPNPWPKGAEPCSRPLEDFDLAPRHRTAHRMKPVLKLFTAHNSICTQKVFLTLLEKGPAVDLGIHRPVQ